ncbi:MFS transporter [Natrinema longum]|uniref:MFS transporter n=1 Tax=Natrinema longum TaxID=370324 RepID=UPI001CCEF697|nr:MFS transporter [Natrinema longum]MBZ6496787.1 MFS transporter [Natrinema longum]
MNRKAVRSVLACSLISAGFFSYLISPASILPLLLSEFDISRTDAGLSISVVYLGWLVFQLPTGYLIDRVDVRSLMFASVVVFVAAVFVGTALTGYQSFLAVRFVAGITGGVLFTASAQIVGQVVQPRYQGTAVTAFTASGPVGFVLGQLGSPLIAERFGWQVVFPVYALITLLGYLLFRRIQQEQSYDAESISLRGFAETLSNPAVLLISLAALCTNSMYLFLNTWIPTFAAEVHALSLAGAGGIAALIPFMGIVARPGGGWLSDRLGTRRRPVIVASFLLSVPVIAVLTQTVTQSVFALFLLSVGFSLQLAEGLYFIYIQEIVPSNVTGTSLAVATSFAIGGALVAPIVGGWLINAISWYAAFAFNILLGLVGIVAILLSPESVDSSTLG